MPLGAESQSSQSNTLGFQMNLTASVSLSACPEIQL